MEIIGKVVQIMPEASGSSAKGTWRKREYIVEQPGQYPKKVCVVIWGDSIDQFALKVGDEVTASVDIESREYNGRWYTDVKVWKVEKGGAQKPKEAATAKSIPDVTTFSDERGDDVLPF
ncbi:DUF3127 domain-containing protein [Cognataquiflexum aquatile]|uniref:DUF3127 domain-containing protein n=1 Tax=Cognataquiflexum aquatile TaxID=2249427 RepID=UPI000DEBF596|nr:DUF3127 domain-containing protein [Cognataquiflexum aquatile]